MSVIVGNGYGSSHDWRAGFTGPSGGTPYHCTRCKAQFSHSYHFVPDIFEAIRKSGVPDRCPILRQDQPTEPKS